MCKKSSLPDKPLIIWVFYMVNQLSILLTHPLCHTKHVYLSTNYSFCDICTEMFCEAFNLFDNFLSILHTFKCGTGKNTIMSSPQCH